VRRGAFGAAAMTPEAALLRCAERHAWSTEGIGLRYHLTGAGADFDGRIRAIQLVRDGRFGNALYQTLHAILLARRHAWQSIALFPFEGGPDRPITRVAGIDFHRPDLPGGECPPGPVLHGQFLYAPRFGEDLVAVPGPTVHAAAREVLRPLFRHLVDRAADLDPTTLVMHFRAGDIFLVTGVHPFYVQPPASYYLAAAAHARRHLAVRAVRLVTEDRANPAIDIVETELRRQGIDVTVQSSSFLEDLACLLGATHLVAPYGTLCEIVALLSERLRSYTAFRNFESHHDFQQRRTPFLRGALHEAGIRCIRISDPAHDYIPPDAWERTEAQMEQIRNFPIERLAVEEVFPGAPELVWPDTAPGPAPHAAALSKTLPRA
jgi:hypothetical protein